MLAKNQRGFTVLELLVAVVVLAIIGTIFFVQKRDLEVANRDSGRKTAISAIYYNLEDIYFATHSAYPEHLTADALKGLDPSQLKDPNGTTVNEQNSDYSYLPKDCQAGKCKSYELRADLENEADFVKNSRNK